jgi:acetyl esterase
MGGAIARIPEPTGWQKFVVILRLLALRISLWFSPRPASHALRRLFEESAAERGAQQLRDAPKDVIASLDQSYDSHPDCTLDVYLPSSATASESSLPVVMWTHGGAFVGGTKDEIGGYLRLLASHGFVVIGVRYSLAPESSYPVPTRQLTAALRWVGANAERFHMDAERIVLAGDSAGAQLSAQLAALITNPVYADALGIPPTIAARRLRGVALCCGIYDLGAIGDRSRFRSLYRAIGWAYSGSRDYRKNSGFLSTVSVLEHVGDAFPPTFVTAGNADPLLRQSQLFTVALIEAGVDVETLFYPEDHEPPLPHEYQFELDLEDARIAFTRLVAFFRRVTSTGEATRHPDVGEAP